MSVSVAATPIRNILTAQTAHTTGAIASVALHETLLYFFSDRTGTLVITGVTDDSTIAFTLRSTQSLGGPSYVYLREDVAADASLAIIGTSSVAGNSQVIGARLASSLGGANYPYFHAAATPNRGEPTDGTNDLTHTSNTVTVTAATSLIMCAVYTGNPQTTLPTARIYQAGVDAGAATVVPAAGAGVRCFLVYASVSTPGDYSIVFTATSTTQSNMHVLSITDEPAGATPPAVTDVDTDESITNEQQNVVATGTDFDTATAHITQGGFTYNMSVDSQSATSIQFDTLALTSGGSAPHPGAAVFVVRNADLQEGTIAITIANAPNTLSVEAADLSIGFTLVFSPAIEEGDFVRWRVTSGTYTVADFTLNANMTYQITAGLLDELVAATATLEVQVWDHNDGTWGAWTAITIQALSLGIGYLRRPFNLNWWKT